MATLLYFLHFLQILHLLHLFHDSLSSNPHLFSFFFEKNDDIFSPLTPEGAIVILNEVKDPTLPTPPPKFKLQNCKLHLLHLLQTAIMPFRFYAVKSPFILYFLYFLHLLHSSYGQNTCGQPAFFLFFQFCFLLKDCHPGLLRLLQALFCPFLPNSL